MELVSGSKRRQRQADGGPANYLSSAVSPRGRERNHGKAGSVPGQKAAVDGLARAVEIIALALFIALFVVVEDGATPSILLINLIAFYFLFIRAILSPDRINPRIPTLLTIEVLFLAFSYIIFYYPYQEYLLGMSDLKLSRYVSYSFFDGSNRAITLATIGMLAFTIGYRIVGKVGPTDRNRHREASGEQRSNRERYLLVTATASSLALLLLVLAFFLAGWRSAGEGRYTGTTTEALGIEGLSIAILMLCMIVAGLWVYASASGLGVPPVLVAGLIVAGAWMLRLLLFGDRSSFLLVALVVLGGYFTFARRASLLLLSALLALWLFLYNVIEVLRSIPNWYEAGNIWALVSGSQYYRETGGESSFNITTMTLRATVEAIPQTHDFMYGTLKVIQFAAPIPFSGKLYLPFLDPEYMHSAQMLGDIMLGEHATWNTGTNVISDSYIDFGVFGVVVVLFLVGLCAKLVRNYVALDPGDAHRAVIYMLTLALFAELPRYAIDLPIRVLAWAVIFSLLSKVVADSLRVRQTAGSLVTPKRAAARLGGGRHASRLRN